MNTKINNLQALRGLAVLFVIFYHMLNIEHKYNYSFSIIPHFFDIGYVGVDIFFVISGFILTTITKDYFGDRSKFYKFIYFRFTRIYPLYWLYTLLLIPILFLKPGWIHQQVNLLSSFLLIPSDKMPLVLVGWTLVYEVYFYIIFGLFILFGVQKKLWIYALLWFSFIGIGGIVFNTKSLLLNFITDPWGVEFISGIVLGIYFLKYDYRIPFAKTLLLISFLSLFIIVYYKNGNLLGVEGWPRILTYGASAFFLVMFAIEVEKQGSILPKFLIILGDASYSIYLSHLFIINFIGMVFSMFWTSGYIYESIMIVTMISVALLAGLFSYKFIETPIINFAKTYYESRKKAKHDQKEKSIEIENNVFSVLGDATPNLQNS